MSMAKPLFIYLMRCNDWYKIGVAANPCKRVRNLQTGNPIPIEIVRETPSSYWGEEKDAFEVERGCHEIAEEVACERRGEWFRFNDPVLAQNAYFAGALPLLGRTWLWRVTGG